MISFSVLFSCAGLKFLCEVEFTHWTKISYFLSLSLFPTSASCSSPHFFVLLQSSSARELPCRVMWLGYGTPNRFQARKLIWLLLQPVWVTQRRRILCLESFYLPQETMFTDNLPLFKWSQNESRLEVKNTRMMMTLFRRTVFTTNHTTLALG